MMSNCEKWFGLKGKNVLITGAAGQLGTALVQGFRDTGANVFGFDLNEPSNLTPFVKFATGDITKKECVTKSYEALFTNDEQVHILVNNAGVSTPANFLERTQEDFYRVTDVNVMGAMFFAQEFVRRHAEKSIDNPAIVNIASIYGVVGPDMRIYTDYNVATPEVYGMSKAALLQMTRYLASVYANAGLRVNAVSPGGIYNRNNPQGKGFVEEYSRRIPLARMAEVEEIVAAVLFLAGPGGSYITGQNIMVDGGLTVW
ncbi:SDR family oxidoreductase [Verrucomicrobia bacterium]|nr:SDR family oxidoreductase [Verrucomicrobiota bacterium]